MIAAARLPLCSEPAAYLIGNKSQASVTVSNHSLHHELGAYHGDDDIVRLGCFDFVYYEDFAVADPRARNGIAPSHRRWCATGAYPR